MNTTVLNESQKKKTLSAKKKLKKQTIKSVLVNPYSDYWPLLNEDDAISLSNVLNEELQLIRRPKTIVPWSDLKHVSRQHRKTARLVYNPEKRELQETFDKFEIAFGVNEATKLLEDHVASSVLITSDVNPRVMVKHIIEMAVSNGVPVLVVPNLRSILKNKTGIGSTVITIKKNFLNSRCWSIDKTIKELSIHYPLPTDHIHYRNDDASSSDKELLSTSMETDIEEDTFKNDPSRSFYLYRKSKNERVFIPELSQKYEVKASVKTEDGSEFLAFGDSLTNKGLASNKQINNNTSVKKKVGYKSLTIKRVTSNQDRNKKIIEMLKKQ